MLLIFKTLIVVPLLRKPISTFISLKSIIGAPTLSSNLCRGSQLTAKEFRNSVRYRLLFIFSIPSSFLTTLFSVVISVSSFNFLIAIELIMSQSMFSGANIALSSGNMPENIYGRTISMRVCGVSGDSGGVSNESGILINSVFGISSKF